MEERRGETNDIKLSSGWRGELTTLEYFRRNIASVSRSAVNYYQSDGQLRYSNYIEIDD